MADQENPAATPDASADDTQTRKTIKISRPEGGTPSTVTLRPAAPAPAPASEQAAPIADPLSGRDTDTGNLEVLSDTQTRKTVKLKPINPMMDKHTVNLDNVPTAPTAVEPAPTNTRKVLMLKPKPVGAATVDPSKQTVMLSNAAAEPPKPADPSKQTIELTDTAAEAPRAINPSKKTVVLSPLEQAPESDTIKVAKVEPAATPVIPEIATSTVPVAPVAAAPAAPAAEDGGEGDDATVKIKRPAIPRPVAPPPAPAAAAAPAAPNIVEPDADKATVKLARPAIPKPAIVPPKPAVVPPKPAVPASAPAPADAPAAPPSAPAAADKEEDAKGGLGLKKDENQGGKAVPPMVADFDNAVSGLKTGKKARSAGSPSMLYTVLGALTLVVLLLAAVVTTIQYLNIHETERIGGKAIDIPVLSEQVK